jgi:hypothetical protein
MAQLVKALWHASSTRRRDSRVYLAAKDYRTFDQPHLRNTTICEEALEHPREISLLSPLQSSVTAIEKTITMVSLLTFLEPAIQSS